MSCYMTLDCVVLPCSVFISVPLDVLYAWQVRASWLRIHCFGRPGRGHSLQFLVLLEGPKKFMAPFLGSL